MATISVRKIAQRLRFRGSASYWERRYSGGGTSGAGSYGEQADYKANFLNRFVAENDVASVIEFGCGDGNQLTLAKYPRYLGLDVSGTAIRVCARRFGDDPSKSFALYQPDLFFDRAGFVRADVVMSLDVIYHLVEDAAFELYMGNLFAAALRFVVIYATDEDREREVAHVRHRRFSRWIETNASQWERRDVHWRPVEHYQDFFVYRRLR